MVCLYWCDRALGMLIATTLCQPDQNRSRTYLPYKATGTKLSLSLPCAGANVTLGCEGAGELATWLLPNRANTSGTLVLHHTGDLLILRAAPAAAGVYTCTAGDTATSFTTRVELRVRTVPDSVTNITVIPHAVYATGKVNI
jgi:hypothetical protein